MPYCTPSLPFPHSQGKPLAELSTFGIGGPARYFAIATSIEAMQQMLAYAFEHKLATFILGKGSNTLFDDRGFDGLVILNQIVHWQQEENWVRVGGGFSFPRLGLLTAKHGLTGLEFASGIPATVGGAIYMNAGVGSQQTADCLHEVAYVTEEGELHHFSKEQMEFSYRHSCFQKWRGAIVEALFVLGNFEGAKQRQKELVDYRLKTQPYKMKSAGCAFRNPPGAAAGQLIEMCGLKGMRIGGVSVSDKHANFIVNDQGGRAVDVLELMALIKEKVYLEKGIHLEEEIRYIAYNGSLSS